jgi:purine-binding chemotaxis protein CheW
MEIPADSVRPAPEMSSAIDACYIRGLAQVGERMVILLGIESMLMSQDMGLID